ncbi:hypothetical protein E5288_WYG005846 [Bos mutus]|uniref:Uncharacterized protein n=1 Tax=Bos mutus TaxID=72004 RepID=A0A6B0QX59_9CETA|nr:hypothetical protein [Bos mutus]
MRSTAAPPASDAEPDLEKEGSCLPDSGNRANIFEKSEPGHPRKKKIASVFCNCLKLSLPGPAYPCCPPPPTPPLAGFCQASVQTVPFIRDETRYCSLSPAVTRLQPGPSSSDGVLCIGKKESV